MPLPDLIEKQSENHKMEIVDKFENELFGSIGQSSVAPKLKSDKIKEWQNLQVCIMGFVLWV